jgi:glycine cleavage system regulatory protein
MRTSLIVTVIGEDRPGIVDQVSDLVLAAGANWEESRMARLAGKFAGILRVSVDPARAADLTAGLAGLEARGLRVIIEPGTSADSGYRTMALELVGNDRPGIVRDISRLLAERGVNIEELETELTSAPSSGDPLFRARARLRTPPTVALDELRRVLELVAHDLMVDLTLDEGRNQGFNSR